MRKVRRGEVGARFLFRAVDTQLFPNPVREGLPTRTKPLARRTLPRGEPRKFRNS